MKPRFLTSAILGILGLSVMGVLQLRGEQETAVSQLDETKVTAVFRAHKEELRAHPDVLGVAPSPEGILIITDRPAAVPQEIDGIPVVIQPPPERLPPPPGGIVLKADGTQEHRPELASCPEGSKEHRLYRWRFCNDVANPQPIPSHLLAPPIAGVPYEEARAIHNRHKAELAQLPGVQTVGLSGEGIRVRTTRPELVPSFIEGLPVKTESSSGLFLRGSAPGEVAQ